MAKLVVFALLGMLALAAALDAEAQGKKHYKSEEKEEDHEYKEWKEYKEKEKEWKEVTIYSTKANVKANHQEWDLLEDVGVTHPCNPQYEILGSTVSQWADLLNKKNGVEVRVGSVYWSGIVTKWDQCEDCNYAKPGEHHIVKVNYQVVFEFTAEHKGQLTCSVMADSIFSKEKVVCSVTGGSGAFEGARGVVTWTYGTPHSKYSFDVYFPKMVEVTKHEVKEHEKKEGDEKKEHEKEEEEEEERHYYRY